MNYIKKLQLDVKNANDNRAEIEAIVNDLSRYLNSNKFNCGDDLDGYVNIKDIFNYINQISLIQNN